MINPHTGQGVLIGASANIKGNQLICSPRWETNIGLQYSTEAGDIRKGDTGC